MSTSIPASAAPAPRTTAPHDAAPGTPPSSRAPRPTVGARVRSRLATYGSTRRILALDVARALAVIGMIAVHTMMVDQFSLAEPSTWPGIAHGHSAGLFAVLGGISIALFTGRQQLPTAADMPRVRLQLVGRGAAIFTLGILLEMLSTSVAVILPVWGILYVAVLPFVRLRRRWLAAWAVGIALVAPLLTALVQWLMLGPSGPGAQLVLYGTYHVPVWLSLMLVGLILGRSPLTRPRFAAALAAGGAATALILLALAPALSALAQDPSGSLGSSGGASVSAPAPVSTPAVPIAQVDSSLVCDANGDGSFYCHAPEDSAATAPANEGTGEEGAGKQGAGTEIPVLTAGKDSPEPADSGVASVWPDYLQRISGGTFATVPGAALDPSPHAGTTAEIATTAAVASTIIGLCLLIARPLRWLLLPLVALGSMPLTNYAAHIIVLFVLAGPTGTVNSPLVFAWLVGALLVASTAWWLVMGRGPLERAVAAVARAAQR